MRKHIMRKASGLFATLGLLAASLVVAAPQTAAIASPTAPVTASTATIAFVIEGRGIQPGLEALCTQFVRIPVLGQVNSLNAAVSAGILFYEVLRQRQPAS